MKEFIIKLFIGMVVNAISVQEIVDAIEKLKLDLLAKVEASPGQWDDMAVAAVLGSEDQVLDLFMMAKELADAKVLASANTTDNVIWLPVSAKLGEIITALKAN